MCDITIDLISKCSACGCAVNNLTRCLGILMNKRASMNADIVSCAEMIGMLEKKLKTIKKSDTHAQITVSAHIYALKTHVKTCRETAPVLATLIKELEREQHEQRVKNDTWAK